MGHSRSIEITGAREHNLENVSIVLPHNRLICFTGVSGSGKSSLAFDTLYAEGKRCYIESLSSYARQFLDRVPKPQVDSITGLARSGPSPNSTIIFAICSPVSRPATAPSAAARSRHRPAPKFSIRSSFSPTA